MKAIIGSWDHRPYQLLAEITALRGRVRDLQGALERAHRENEQLRARLREQAIDLDDLEPVVDVDAVTHDGDRVELGA